MFQLKFILMWQTFFLMKKKKRFMAPDYPFDILKHFLLDLKDTVNCIYYFNLVTRFCPK